MGFSVASSDNKPRPTQEPAVLSPRNLDIHLLECFDMLMRERNVSRAAERLGISQSSTSEALARLRERFDDPLLVRGREGMMPTPKAQSLLPDVRSAISLLHGLIDRSHAFDPARSALRFRLATSDYTQLLLMPALCRRLTSEAPGCAIDIVPTHILRVEEALDTGEIDLAIAYFPEPPLSLRRSPLLQDDYVCIARQGHPCTRQALTAGEFAALSHIAVAPSGLSYFSSVVDSALEALGLSRRITVSSPHFLLAAHVASQSDMVLALPRRAARALVELIAIQIVEIPLPMRAVDVAMYWHERTHHSPPHQWLRGLLRELLAAPDPAVVSSAGERRATDA